MNVEALLPELAVGKAPVKSMKEMLTEAPRGSERRKGHVLAVLRGVVVRTRVAFGTLRPERASLALWSDLLFLDCLCVI